jgi:hypothetical protein
MAMTAWLFSKQHVSKHVPASGVFMICLHRVVSTHGDSAYAEY